MPDGSTGARSGHALSLRNLSKVYGSLAAVDGVDLDVPRGSFLTLLGPSGSGKTTILMAIAGFVEPSGGSILLDDKDITRFPPDKRNFGMVFQGYALFPHMTVADNIWFPLKVRGVSKADAASKIKNALELVQMGHLAERYPSQLSGGQQQRVALARAIVFEPDLLLLDEPLSALDKKLRADLQWELKSLHQRLGTTFIYVTHEQEEALSMSDTIIILRDGQIEQQGGPGELYEWPATRFVADFLGPGRAAPGEDRPVAGTPWIDQRGLRQDHRLQLLRFGLSFSGPHRGAGRDDRHHARLDLRDRAVDRKHDLARLGAGRVCGRARPLIPKFAAGRGSAANVRSLA